MRQRDGGQQRSNLLLPVGFRATYPSWRRPNERTGTRLSERVADNLERLARFFHPFQSRRSPHPRDPQSKSVAELARVQSADSGPTDPAGRRLRTGRAASDRMAYAICATTVPLAPRKTRLTVRSTAISPSRNRMPTRGRSSNASATSGSTRTSADQKSCRRVEDRAAELPRHARGSPRGSRSRQ